MRLSLAVLVAVLFTAPAFSQPPEEPPAEQPAFDFEAMGPWTRAPSNVQKTQREVRAFWKEQEAAMKQGDMEAMLSAIDFPVFMMTDDSKGVPYAKPYSRQEYKEMMQPFMEQWPEDAQTIHRPNIVVLSDSLVSYTDDFTVKVGQRSYRGRSAGTLVKRDGEWKWKTMVEPGWGEMPEAGVGGAGEEPGVEQPEEPKLKPELNPSE